MIDLYLLNIIVNSIWYLFTILFVLYKFTTFFSYVYNFSKFCWRLGSGVYYTCNQIFYYIGKKKNYVSLPEDDNFTAKKTIFEKCKEFFNKKYTYYYNRFFGKNHSNTNNIHLTETFFSSTMFDRRNDSSGNEELLYYNKYTDYNEDANVYNKYTHDNEDTNDYNGTNDYKYANVNNDTNDYNDVNDYNDINVYSETHSYNDTNVYNVSHNYNGANSCNSNMNSNYSDKDNLISQDVYYFTTNDISNKMLNHDDQIFFNNLENKSDFIEIPIENNLFIYSNNINNIHEDVNEDVSEHGIEDVIEHGIEHVNEDVSEHGIEHGIEDVNEDIIIKIGELTINDTYKQTDVDDQNAKTYINNVDNIKYTNYKMGMSVMFETKSDTFKKEIMKNPYI